MAELVILDRFLPSGYTQLEYIESDSQGACITTDFVLNSASSSWKHEVGLMFTYIPAGYDDATMGWNSTNHHFFGRQGSTWRFTSRSAGTVMINTLYDVTAIQYPTTYDRFIIKENGTELFNGTTSKVYSSDWTSDKLTILNRNNSSTGDIMKNTRIYYYKLYRDGNLIFDGIPAKRNSDNELGLYDIVNDVFYAKTAGVGSFINGQEVSLNYARVPALVVEKGAPIKKYNLYDRVKDDSNNDIGIVTGFFTAGPEVGIEYAIVCLNAQYRIESGNSNATYCTSTVSNQKYYTTIEDVWNTTDTATEINDALYTEKSSAAKAIHYLRTNFSFTIEGNVYKPQVPNIPELYSILNNFTVINNSDPTASSYPAKTLKTGTELGAVPPSFPESQYGYRSCQFNGNWTTLSYWACGFIGYQGTYHKDGISTGSNIYAFVVPVLELPNQIIG